MPRQGPAQPRTQKWERMPAEMMKKASPAVVQDFQWLPSRLVSQECFQRGGPQVRQWDEKRWISACSDRTEARTGAEPRIEPGKGGLWGMYNVGLPDSDSACSRFDILVPQPNFSMGLVISVGRSDRRSYGRVRRVACDLNLIGGPESLFRTLLLRPQARSVSIRHRRGAASSIGKSRVSLRLNRGLG